MLSVIRIYYKPAFCFQEERLIAENQSAFINKAYTTLLKPLSRGLYLLELKGNPLDERDSAVDPSFLAEVMEINEELVEGASNSEVMKDLEKSNAQRVAECVKDVSEAFQANNITLAKDALIRLKYFVNLDDKIREIFRKHMEA